MQDSKEILKNIQNEVEQQQEKINSKIKKWTLPIQNWEMFSNLCNLQK
ncbi:hypothetical protein [Spiroplasma ixodetis]|uniref:Uncharacterized protein n=1 Tax=Spiroplasma ixodetis TaxID=2141 RepID=A0ABM8BWY3_9MOLU|nr:hypothetical protein [Spiroplasma ixodetis]BDT04391.1 hypothetical protein SHM_20370 [Spiroplasma ixodetis]